MVAATARQRQLTNPEIEFGIAVILVAEKIDISQQETRAYPAKMPRTREIVRPLQLPG